MIRFFCPGCGQLVQTSDRLAGRKGQCPHCEIKVQIPTTSLVPADLPPKAPEPPAAQAPASGTLALSCGKCGGRLRVSAAHAGKKGKCIHCGVVMTIPVAPTGRLQPPARTAAKTSIEFICSSCHRSVKVGGTAAGKKGQCPHCHSVIQIPTQQ